MLFPKLSSYLFTLAAVRLSLASPFHNGGASIAPLYIPPAPAQDLLNNSYIVILKDDISPSAFSAHLNFVSLVREVSPLQDDVHELASEHVYNSVVAKGYAGKFSQDAVKMIRRRPEVQYIEQDSVVYGDDIQHGAPWVCISYIGTFLC